LCDYLQLAVDNLIKLNISKINPQKGSFIVLSISKVPEALHPFRNCLISMILNDYLKTNVQVEEFIKFFKSTT